MLNSVIKLKPPPELSTPTIAPYLGERGYTILKQSIPDTVAEYIRTSLTIRPYTAGAPLGSVETFLAYREGPTKIYVPRYFGEALFGPIPISNNRVPNGDNITLTFRGNMRSYQMPVVEKYLQHSREGISGGERGLLELPCAWGKTSASLYILAALKKKTIVVVHKEFLMNQWIERINQFLPAARIGTIRGQIIDIENKDIVLCMLQSLSMKDYPAGLFSSFGFTIIDEVHHIGSNTFSNALFKVGTQYMLGLSATMVRKDGTTDVIKMFLGKVVHKAEQASVDGVTVRLVNYIPPIDDDDSDDNFRKVIYDYRGKPQNSTMISKLCAYSPRTECIIKELVDFIAVDECVASKEYQKAHKLSMDNAVIRCAICFQTNSYLMKNTCCGVVKYCLPCLIYTSNESNTNNDNNSLKKRKIQHKCPDCKKVLRYEQEYIENPYVLPTDIRQTIVLSHNLNLLEYIYNKFVCKNYASVGYYVGGMKESQLKESETKQVILATYAMAAEALDIPSLNAEFLITPKTDVVQSIGRILRAKHAISSPVIYDFVDVHCLFQRQAQTRQKYYKKQKYNIISTNSNTLHDNQGNIGWNTVHNGQNTDNDDNVVIGKCLIKL